MTVGSSESPVLHLEVLLWPCNRDVALTAVALEVAGNSLVLPGVHTLLLSHHQTLRMYTTVAQASQAHIPTYTLGKYVHRAKICSFAAT